MLQIFPQSLMKIKSSHLQRKRLILTYEFDNIYHVAPPSTKLRKESNNMYKLVENPDDNLFNMTIRFPICQYSSQMFNLVYDHNARMWKYSENIIITY